MAKRLVSIRFEARGGFRQQDYESAARSGAVSIRFEVRGGFRQSDFRRAAQRA